MQKQLQVHDWAYTVMKISLFQILLSIALFSMSYAENTFAQGVLEKKVSIELRNTSLRNALAQLEKLSDARFMYHTQLISSREKVSLKANEEPLAAVLDKLLMPFQIGYEVSGKQIVLTRNTETTTEEQAGSDQSNAQEILDFTVSGTVKDESGASMPGVNVVLKGTATGTSTDAEGKYVLTVPDGDGVLVFSFIGYTTEEVAIGNRTVVDINLIPDIATLSEVVVVGYGTVRKRDLTGAVVSVKSEDIVRTPTHNAVESLQGRVVGMDVVRDSGIPGASTNVVIRGNKSITDRDKLSERNAPMYVVDGYQLPQGSTLDALNPNDIESIEVLKDASATAIYGAMGANGVVIVTTKKGAEGKAKVSYNGYYGVNTYSFPHGRIGDEYIEMRREAAKTTGEWSDPDDDPLIFTTEELDFINDGKWVDWVDLLTDNGNMQSHSISVSGGSEKTKVFTSAGYFREEGMLSNSDFTRYNVRFNLDQTIGSRVKTGVLSQLTYSIHNRRRDPLNMALTSIPLGDPYEANGNINSDPFGTGDPGPLNDEKGKFIARDNMLSTTILMNGYLELSLIKGLTFRSNLGATISFSRRGIYNDKESLARMGNGTSYASSETGFARFYNWDNVLTYAREFGNHSLTVAAITSYLQSDADNLSANGTNQIASSQLFYGLDGTQPGTIYSPYEGWKNMAYAGRINYSYNGKYLLTLTGRQDGSSRLAPGNKWAFFPSVAVGWNVSDESFLSGTSTITNLKLRASYGTSGNYAIDVYGTQSGLVAGRNMSFGEVPAPMYQFKSSIGNPNLGWETSATTNIGLDIAVLKNRISSTIDLYQTVTSDILMSRNLPQSTGVVSIFQNIAETKNRGIEISVTSRNIDKDDFSWTSTATFFSNKEEITALIDGTDIITNERESLLLGHPISSFYTYDKLGIWQTDQADEAAQYRQHNATGSTFEPGDIRLADINGDFIISADSDRVYVGSTVPKFVAGLQNTFRYKAFDLNVFLFMRYGQTVNAEYLGRFNPSGTGNGPETMNYWTPENPTNDFPRPIKGEQFINYLGYQSVNFVDGSFFKIKNVTLGYTMPESLIQKIGASRLRLYVTGNNLFVSARSHFLKDYDPERGGAESAPLSRTVVFGVNVDF